MGLSSPTWQTKSPDKNNTKQNSDDDEQGHGIKLVMVTWQREEAHKFEVFATPSFRVHGTVHHSIGHSIGHGAAQRSTAQHSTAQHSTAQHSTAQHSTAQHSTAQHGTARHSMGRHGTAWYGPTRPSTAQHTTAEHAHSTSTVRHGPAHPSPPQPTPAQPSLAQSSRLSLNSVICRFMYVLWLFMLHLPFKRIFFGGLVSHWSFHCPARSRQPSNVEGESQHVMPQTALVCVEAAHHSSRPLLSSPLPPSPDQQNTAEHPSRDPSHARPPRQQ